MRYFSTDKGFFFLKIKVQDFLPSNTVLGMHHFSFQKEEQRCWTTHTDKYTVILYVSTSAKFGISTIVGLIRILEDKMRRF